jgi:hypothetical protein
MNYIYTELNNRQGALTQPNEYVVEVSKGQKATRTGPTTWCMQGSYVKNPVRDNVFAIQVPPPSMTFHQMQKKVHALKSDTKKTAVYHGGVLHVTGVTEDEIKAVTTNTAHFNLNFVNEGRLVEISRPEDYIAYYVTEMLATYEIHRNNLKSKLAKDIEACRMRINYITKTRTVNMKDVVVVEGLISEFSRDVVLKINDLDKTDMNLEKLKATESKLLSTVIPTAIELYRIDLEAFVRSLSA